MASGKAEPTKTFRPWWRKKRWIGLGLFAVWFTGNWFLPRFPFGPFTLYGDLTDELRAARIAYVTLSSEATHPFRPYRFRFPGYDRAVARFPDARSCLVKSERDKPDPDIRLIDWYAIGGFGLPWQGVTDTAEVCLFRLFAGMTPETVAKWLEFQGFNVYPLKRYPNVLPKTGYYYSLPGGFLTRNKESSLPWSLHSLFLFNYFFYSETINISYDEEYKLLSLSYGGNAL
ncbi:MAG: hypothetical protein IPL47_17490 [Phyllobacteriaceae bacterium]|nr:hypothetical protein [Phyllobacteriaceae bacterium]